MVARRRIDNRRAPEASTTRPPGPRPKATDPTAPQADIGRTVRKQVSQLFGSSTDKWNMSGKVPHIASDESIGSYTTKPGVTSRFACPE